MTKRTYSLEELRWFIHGLVDQCRMYDGTQPRFTAISMSGDDVAMIESVENVFKTILDHKGDFLRLIRGRR